mmetsp:Transcript_13667/g.29764  ORF Transcript_13667/g.29764 Transcript_13667/m.29764 type:complete len:239 (+) Transcript_13667:1190-1906(+)
MRALHNLIVHIRRTLTHGSAILHELLDLGHLLRLLLIVILGGSLLRLLQLVTLIPEFHLVHSKLGLGTLGILELLRYGPAVHIQLMDPGIRRIDLRLERGHDFVRLLNGLCELILHSGIAPRSQQPGLTDIVRLRSNQARVTRYLRRVLERRILVRVKKARALFPRPPFLRAEKLDQILALEGVVHGIPAHENPVDIVSVDERPHDGTGGREGLIEVVQKSMLLTQNLHPCVGIQPRP